VGRAGKRGKSFVSDPGIMAGFGKGPSTDDSP